MCLPFLGASCKLPVVDKRVSPSLLPSSILRQGLLDDDAVSISNTVRSLPISVGRVNVNLEVLDVKISDLIVKNE